MTRPKADFSAGYVRRVVDAELDDLIDALPALWLDGPKAVGKTATASQRATTIRRLDRPAVRQIAESDPELALAGQPPVLLDEWQRLPAVWDAVKAAVDADTSPGQFLLTGSAASGTHSGAGRIKAVRMRPLTLPERGVAWPTVSVQDLLNGDRMAVDGESDLNLADYVDLILGSGFPAFQRLSGRSLRAQLDGYLDRIVDVDLEESGLRVRRPATVRAWLRAFAAATATSASWEKIRAAATPGSDLKPARSTVIPYVDALTRLRIIDDLEAWAPGHGHLRRLSQAPKHHLADPALAARLVGVSRSDLLDGRAGSVEFPRDGTFLGALFESLCALSLRVFAQQCEASTWHMRIDSGRHEVDFVLERDDGLVVAIESKLSPTVTDRDVRHLRWLGDQIGDRLMDAVVLTTGERAYRRADGVAVVPLALLGP
jgi:predicted AAA+ superfamily ATPase